MSSTKPVKVSFKAQMLLARPTTEQAAGYMGEFLRFVYGGWNSIINQ